MDVEQLKQQLQQQLETLTERATRAEQHAMHTDAPLPGDFAEQATERENDDVLFEISHEAEVQAQQIRQALQRIEAGYYGECFECGEPISEARLQALPWALRCVSCEQHRHQQH